MKKKTRDLKKHYREIEGVLSSFDIDLSKESWYSMWHTHLDWSGVTSLSSKHRKIHFLYYLKIFKKIELQTKDTKRDFQAWIYIDGHDGAYDAIYFHTENPHGNFPYYLDNIKWNIEIPSMLLDVVDLSELNVGVIKNEKENSSSYIIQKKALGINIEFLEK